MNYVSFMRMCNLALIAIEFVDDVNSHKAPRLWLDPTYRKSTGSIQGKVVFSMLQLYSSSKILHFISQVLDVYGFVSSLCYNRNHGLYLLPDFPNWPLRTIFDF